MNTAALEPPEMHFIHGIRCVFTALITFDDVGSPDSMGHDNIWIGESNLQWTLTEPKKVSDLSTRSRGFEACERLARCTWPKKSNVQIQKWGVAWDEILAFQF